MSADFESTLENVKSGDIVYCDPPYTLAHSNNGFVEYNAQVFSWNDQRRLAAAANELRRMGAHVLVSNADHPSITRLYPKAAFRRVRLRRWSTMASKSSRRFPTSELLLIGDG
jgi:DNA adenine methylase